MRVTVLARIARWYMVSPQIFSIECVILLN